MTSYEGYGFYFEEEGLAGHQGPINPSEEYFKHRQLEKALAREMIQNSLDAKRSDRDCVEVQFELRYVACDEIPGIEDLRQASESAWESNKDLQGAESIRIAAAATKQSSKVPVLRIGDYETRGLTGSESIDDPKSALSALTRGSGVSSTEGSRGGSFGIGSAVGFAASRMRTVAYLSHPWNAEPVFAASARFASHKDRAGVRRVPWGYFTDLEIGKKGNFRYLRNAGAFPGFDPRSQSGTDVFVLDYLRAKDDPDLVAIREAVIEDFMVAIHTGKLRVKGLGSKRWELNHATLGQYIEESDLLRESTLPYYSALTVGTPHVSELPSIGRVRLYVHIDPERSTTMRSGTQLMRSPLMRVTTIHHRFNTPYAAVFICDDPKGDSLLRNIEPPTHDEWSEKGARSNEKVVRAIKRYIREKLADGMKKEYSRELTIKGLESRLPVLSAMGKESASKHDIRSTKPRRSAPAIQESPALLGVRQETEVRSRPAQPVALSVTRGGIASPGGDHPAMRGNRSGQDSSKEESTVGIKTRGNEGNGRSLISSKDVSIRSFYNKQERVHFMTLAAHTPVSGDLRIEGIGMGGSTFELPVDKAWLRSPDSGSLVSLPVSGSVIGGINAEPGETQLLIVRFAGDGRYRIGVGDE